MLLQIPQVLTRDELRAARRILDRAPWGDGRASAGDQEGVSRACPLANGAGASAPGARGSARMMGVGVPALALRAPVTPLAAVLTALAWGGAVP